MKFIKKKILAWKINLAAKFLLKIDLTMKSLNMPQWKRKQMWRDFYKSESARMNVIKILTGEKP